VPSIYRSVLSVGGAPRLLASALFGRLPQGMSSLAILLLVRGSTHSYAAAGVAVGANALATAAIAPVQGRLIDRAGRGRVLAPVALAQSGLLVLLVLAAQWQAGTGALVALAGLAGAFVPSIASTVRALLNEVMEDPKVRESAYALESIAQELVWIVGPLLVGIVVALTSPSVAVLLLGVVCVSGTLVFVRSPLAARRPTAEDHAGRVPALSSGPLRRLLGPIALTGFGLGAIEVGLPSLALHAGSRSASGVLLALWSLGSMAGGLWFGSRAWRASLASRYRSLLIAAVALTAPLILARSVPAGAVCAILAGLAIAPVFSCQYALVGRVAAPGSQTEAFTWVTSALVAGIAGGAAVGGAVISSGGVAAPFVLGCSATLLAAVLAMASRGRVVQLARGPRAGSALSTARWRSITVRKRCWSGADRLRRNRA
jgi:predicted MFS family arabinose efflux permease